VGKTLNGSQTSSLITVIKGLKSGDITEGQAVRILTTSIGVTREEALAIIRGEE
jgi:predicted ABC-type transport system involved in lysophospholipase L1 biosynthesis ATPase subunit